jgi:hypothetical protein
LVRHAAHLLESIMKKKVMAHTQVMMIMLTTLMTLTVTTHMQATMIMHHMVRMNLVG